MRPKQENGNFWHSKGDGITSIVRMSSIVRIHLGDLILSSLIETLNVSFEENISFVCDFNNRLCL